MKITKITKITDFYSLLPNLDKKSKFKKPIEQLLNSGFTFDLFVAEDLSGFHNKKDVSYKYLIKCEKTFIRMGRIRVRNYHMSDEESKQYCIIEKNGSIYTVEEWIDPTWVELCKAVGKIIKESLVEYDVCPRCGGTGHLPQYSHYCEGLCFECLGVGKWVLCG